MRDPIGFGDLRKGMKARVIGVSGAGAHVTRLVEMGLTPGVVLSVTKVAPLGDPVEIDVRGSRLCLRRRESLGIELEQLE